MQESSFWQGIVAEWLKTKRTPIRWLAFLTPVLMVAAILGYFSGKGVTPDFQRVIYDTFFEVWCALVIPLQAGLISGLMVYQEEQAGHFNRWFASPAPRSRHFLAKFLMLTGLSMGSPFIATLLLGLGIQWFFSAGFSWPIFLSAAWMAACATLPLLAFHFWISIAWGLGPSIAVGGGGILIAAIMATSFGDAIWPWVPWGWPVRLSLLPAFFWLPGGLPAMMASLPLMRQAAKGLILATIFFAFALGGGILWFLRWEGRKVYE